MHPGGAAARLRDRITVNLRCEGLLAEAYDAWMLRWLEAGYDVEGVDGSADMLAVRRNAAERGLDPLVHHGDIAPLDLGRTYAAIVCPAGT